MANRVTAVKKMSEVYAYNNETYPVWCAATDDKETGGTYSCTAAAIADARSLEGIPRASAKSFILCSTLVSPPVPAGCVLSPPPPADQAADGV